MSTEVRFHSAMQDLLMGIESITPDERNPNRGDIDAIIESITLNGVYRPVYVSQQTGQIVAGHHLYAALREMGAARVPVQWVDGDMEQATRILLADNQVARLAKLDDAQVLDLLRWLENTDTGLLGTGFTDESIEALMNEMQPSEHVEMPSEAHAYPHVCPHCGSTWVGPCRPEE